MPSKKVKKNIYAGGLWVEYGHPQDDYTASAGWIGPSRDADEQFFVSYHKGRTPAFNTVYFDSLQQLEAAMRGIAPLHKWKTRSDE